MGSLSPPSSMARHRNSSYSSETISSQIKSGEFWNRFNRRAPSNSVLSLLQHFFSPKVKGEPSKPSKPSKPVLSVSTVITIDETSFSCRAPPVQNSFPSHCPPGLYCVIDDFLTDYDLRLLEEEERADLLARKSKEINNLQKPNITV